MTRAKNILFITSDEMRGDVQGFIGNPDIKTPNLDALAARGCVFEKHFAPFPKCVPSRCTMQTGRYTHTDGIRTVMKDNHLPVGTPTMLEFLSQQGYETAVFGLNHVWDQEWFYGAGDQVNKKSAGVVDYQSYTEGPIADTVSSMHRFPPGEQATGPHIDALQGSDYIGLEQGDKHCSRDDNRCNQAALYLERIRDPDKPFYLQLNLGKPHPPYAVHEPWYSMYDRETMTPFPYDLPENACLPLRAMREHRLGHDIPEASLREIQAVYYGMVSFIDELVGGVIAKLDELGLSDDTLIIFTADHGDYAGQYGINEKWDASLQDCLLRVPFIMAGPDIPAGERLTGMSEHVDIPATVFDYLGYERPEDWVWHGRSLLPMIENDEHRDYVFADGGHEKAMRDRICLQTKHDKNGKRIKNSSDKQRTYIEVPDAMARCKMIRSERWKLVIREVGGNEFFDMQNDPHEMKNLYDDPAHQQTIAEMTLRLVEWCLATDTDRPFLAKFGA